ncbi:MAG: OmpA/MotB family protein [Rhodospirillales bacterium]
MAAAQTNVTDVEPQQGTFAWMVIFTDLIALMLTFFVLLFSMSNVTADKWKSITDALSQSLRPNSTQTEAKATAQFNITGIFRKQAIDLDYLTSILTEAASKDTFLAQAQFIRLEDRMMISIPGDLLFEGGLADLTEEAQRAISDLGGALRNIGNKVIVNGHSEPGKVAGGTYTSNWELSLARAVAVANTIRQSGYTEDLSAFGFADGRFKYLPALPDQEKRALGRRVDIVVMPTIGRIDEE